MTITIVRANRERGAVWLALRAALWPDAARRDLADELARLADDAAASPAWLALDGAGEAAGLAEASLRRDHVNGCEGSPVAFLEGLYVASSHRRQGIARALDRAVAAWAVDCGCRDYASDAALANHVAHAVHEALGFAETERVVFFRRAVGP